jgi:hypothetical protein
MRWIWGASEFLRKIRCQLRFGERSRAPLKFLRLELREHSAQCEWLARAHDPWDEDLPVELREEHHALQALHDALAVREFLFSSLPEIDRATVKVYRTTSCRSRQLIMTGLFSRGDEPPPRVASLVMRAKLCGLRFNLLDGVFENLSSEASELQLTHQ